MRRLAVVVCVATLLGACAHSPAPKPAIYAGASPDAKLAADDRLDATLWTQTAIEHDLVYSEVYRLAEQKLAQAITDPDWDALPTDERSNDATDLPAAVILDIDETVLDNSPFQARLIRDNAEFNDIAWNAWVQQKAARALPGALEFAKSAAAQGVTLFYLTNRDDTMINATRENLAALGFPLIDGVQAVMGNGTNTPDCVAKDGDKGCRRKWVAQHYRVLQMFGDQLGDFIDGADADNATRTKRALPYRDWFGERWFVLPNPDYGSWEDALTRHATDAKLRTEPRAAKHAALRDN